jgi:regulator of protease activity HflC (stomatin/prohibitin superfamily)
MEFLIFLIVVAAVVAAGVFWVKKYFRNEIERAKRITRANKNK